MCLEPFWFVVRASGFLRESACNDHENFGGKIVELFLEMTIVRIARAILFWCRSNHNIFDVKFMEERVVTKLLPLGFY